MSLMKCISLSPHSLMLSLTHSCTVTSAGIKAQMSAPGLSHTKSGALTLRGAELTDRDKRLLCPTHPAPWSDGAARHCVVRQKTALSGTVHGQKKSTFSTIHLYPSVICNLPSELWHWYCPPHPCCCCSGICSQLPKMMIRSSRTMVRWRCSSYKKKKEVSTFNLVNTTIYWGQHPDNALQVCSHAFGNPWTHTWRAAAGCSWHFVKWGKIIL